jgi:hypothetical protein
MTPGHKIVVGYLVAVSVAFFAGYLLLGIRELGLYLLLMAINLPASFVIVPGIEKVSLSMGWVLGAPVHVYSTQLSCMAANGVFLIALAKILRKYRHWNSRGNGVR